MTAFSGFIGILLILLTALLLSHHKRHLDWRLIIRGLALQVFLGVMLLQIPLTQTVFRQMGVGIERLLHFADEGAAFVFGPMVAQPDIMESLFGPGGSFIFAVKLLSSIIFISTLVALAYHLGLLQATVRVLAWLISRLVGASGAEALSNTASVFVGQVEAQLLVKPYLASMTRSELLTVMSGSMACIAGGVLAIYVSMGIPAEYLLTASLMAIPGALVIAKLVIPETAQPVTRGTVSVQIERRAANLIDAAAHGAMEGWQIGISVIVMLIAFLALIGLGNALLSVAGNQLAQWNVPAVLGLPWTELTLQTLLGSVFYWVALALGVPSGEAATVGSLMGTKLVLNEFVAYSQLQPMLQQGLLSPKATAIATFALCGFANVASIAIQVGGIGAMVPERKSELARLGGWALLCGTLASYLSASLAGILVTLQPAVQASAPWLPYGVMALAAGVILAVSLLPSGPLGISAASVHSPSSPPAPHPDKDAIHQAVPVETTPEGVFQQAYVTPPPQPQLRPTPAAPLPPLQLQV